MFAPLLIAIDRGYFTDEDIAVQITEPDDHPWGAVARGAAEVGAAYIDYGARPEFLGAYKAVAVQERLSRGLGLVTLYARAALLDGGALRTESGLRGRKIALADRRRGDDYLSYYFPLQRAGLTFEDIEIVTLPHAGPERDAAVERGDVDILVGRRPREGANEERRGWMRRWLVGAQVAPDWQCRFIIFGSAFIASAPDVGRAFLRAYRRGAQDYIDGTRDGKPSETFLPYLVELSKETPEVLDNSLPAGFPDEMRIDVAALERDTALLAQAGIYPNDVPVSELVDLRFTLD